MMTLKEVHEETKDFAREAIVKTGEVRPMFVGFDADDNRHAIATPMPEDPDERDQLGAIVGALLRSRGCTRYAFISEVWLSKMANAERLELHKQGKSGGPMPSECPDRRDGLTIISCDDQGHTISAMYEVKKTGEQVELVQDQPEMTADEKDPSTGRMEGRFHDLLRKADHNLVAATTLLATLKRKFGNKVDDRLRTRPLRPEDIN